MHEIVNFQRKKDNKEAQKKKKKANGIRELRVNSVLQTGFWYLINAMNEDE